MIVNFLGPPCGGKSYIASRYTIEHPYWDYLSIDACRVEEEDEAKAWDKFTKKLDNSNRIIIESSGLSWRLPFILKLQNKRPILSIALLADSSILQDRLEERQNKRKIPYKRRMDEKQAIDWVIQNINNCEYPIDHYIYTDKMSKDSLYNHISEIIASFRLVGDKK